MNRLREALAEREQSTADATRKGDDMCRLLADVAHEIRTPLTALKSYSNLHAKEMLAAPGALDRAMSRVGDESIRLNVLVNSMLHSLSAMARTRRSLMSRLWITVLGWPKTNARRFSRLSTAQIRREFETAMMDGAGLGLAVTHEIFLYHANAVLTACGGLPPISRMLPTS